MTALSVVSGRAGRIGSCTCSACSVVRRGIEDRAAFSVQWLEPGMAQPLAGAALAPVLPSEHYRVPLTAEPR
jgi:hypothetical protein